jgi:hypothetical protein
MKPLEINLEGWRGYAPLTELSHELITIRFNFDTFLPQSRNVGYDTTQAAGIGRKRNRAGYRGGRTVVPHDLSRGNGRRAHAFPLISCAD